MENIKAKIQGILLNCSQKSVIGWAVEEDDFEAVAEEIVKKLFIGGVGSSNKVDYKKGFELAKIYIDESPCDPDIYKEQLSTWDKYQIWLKNNNLT